MNWHLPTDDLSPDDARAAEREAATWLPLAEVTRESGRPVRDVRRRGGGRARGPGRRRGGGRAAAEAPSYPDPRPGAPHRRPSPAVGQPGDRAAQPARPAVGGPDRPERAGRERLHVRAGVRGTAGAGARWRRLARARPVCSGMRSARPAGPG
ncbi:hypothetical protein [Nocardioides convexus]|uniref:hypothetical protein n=1 Tax=Nocardioides convexus TaxID=2712224 RepID=UPI00241828FA|nr:hypothetical protein [Nocardioides convexus]